MRRLSLQDWCSVVIGACALGVSSVVVWDRFQGQPPARGAFQAPVRVPDWEDARQYGHRLGVDDPVVQVVIWSDLECPACKGFEDVTLQPFFQDNQSEVQIITRHWPLPQHKAAFPSAIAAECAAEQDRFYPFYHAVLAKQDSLLLKPFNELAVEAGVDDLEKFEACRRNPEKFKEIIERDTEAVGRLGGTGTPTVVVNGWQFRSLPRRSDLDSILDAGRANRLRGGR